MCEGQSENLDKTDNWPIPNWLVQEDNVAYKKNGNLKRTMLLQFFLHFSGRQALSLLARAWPGDEIWGQEPTYTQLNFQRYRKGTFYCYLVLVLIFLVLFGKFWTKYWDRTSSYVSSTFSLYSVNLKYTELLCTFGAFVLRYRKGPCALLATHQQRDCGAVHSIWRLSQNSVCFILCWHSLAGTPVTYTSWRLYK